VSTSALARIADLFARAEVEYAVIGAHGVNAWLEPRFTADIDVTACIDAPAMLRLRGVFADAGYQPTVEHGAHLPSGPDFIRFASADRLTIVEIQAAKTALQHEVVRRARASSDGIRVATPEDLIVLKLIADRPKDRQDLLGLVALPGLDWAHVERWATEWDVAEKLAALRRPAIGT
jgi:hypothetical protein